MTALRLRGRFRLPGRGSPRERSVGRWVVTALGLGVIAAALVPAADAYRQSREFHKVVVCERGTADCFAREPGRVVARRTYTTTTTYTDANGHLTTTTTRHFEVTWQRADGTRQARDVSSGLFDKARVGEPATLRVWRGEVVGIEVMGAAQWFLPDSGEALGYWLCLAWFGLGVVLWALLAGWFDGLFMLAFRTFAWMFMSIVPVSITTQTLTYGPPAGIDLVMTSVCAIMFVGTGATLLISSLSRW
jgi:hypothetical protein